MLICVDGTGPLADGEYAERMKNSFVKTIADTSPMANKRYYRGPDWKEDKLVQPDWLVGTIQGYARQGDRRLLMAGYSRGGAVVINTAVRLQHLGIDVEALFLFDAVDRSLMLNATLEIPPNVERAYYAKRMEAAASRESFGNCGLIMRGSGQFFKAEFYTTHGGMGGTPWGARGVEKQLGFVGQALTPCANESDVQFARAVGHKPPLSGPMALQAQRDQIMMKGYIDEGGLDGFTKISPAQEQQGMEAVHRWMWEYLWQHGVIA